MVDTDGLTDGRRDCGAIAGQKRRRNAQGADGLDGPASILARAIADAQGSQKPRSLGDEDLGALVAAGGSFGYGHPALVEKVSATDRDFLPVGAADNTLPRRVRKRLGRRGAERSFRGFGQDRLREWMLGPRFRTRRCHEKFLAIHTGRRLDGGHDWRAIGQSAGLVENSGVDVREDFERQTPLDDGAAPCGLADCPEDCKRRTGGDAAGAGNNDHGDGRSSVASQ